MSPRSDGSERRVSSADFTAQERARYDDAPLVARPPGSADPGGRAGGRASRPPDIHHLSTPDQRGLLTGERRLDFDLIVEMVHREARVLDLGAGDGTLLARLRDERDAFVRGVELSQAGVKACIGKGLSVFQGDLDEGLADFAEGAFDYVVLSQTLQVVHRPDLLLSEMLRVGRQAIVSFPNFGYWRTRWHLALTGRLPKTRALPYEWYDTPNIRLVTIPDFRALAARLGLPVAWWRAIGGHPTRSRRMLANLRAEFAVFALARPSARGDGSGIAAGAHGHDLGGPGGPPSADR